jgi:hypothetical protein
MQKLRQDTPVIEAVPPREPRRVAGPGPGIGAEAADRLEAMRRHLTAARPTSGNEALRLLRAAFPHAPLAERVKAAEGIDRYRF